MCCLVKLVLYSTQTWNPNHKDIDNLERVQQREITLISELKDFVYETCLFECGQTTLKIRTIRGDQLEVFMIPNGYKDVDRNSFFKLKDGSITRRHNVALELEHCWMDIRKNSSSQRTMIINDWNKLSADCINASSVNVNKLNLQLSSEGKLLVYVALFPIYVLH